MDEHRITAKETIGVSTYEAAWDLNTGGLRITRDDGTVIKDWHPSEAHVAVHTALEGIGPYVTAVPSEEQLLAVIRFYAGPLQELLDAPGAPFINTEEILAQISDEFGSAKTEEMRVILLGLFKTTMDIVERRFTPEDLEQFKTLRNQFYNGLLIREAFVGEDVSPEILDAVTQREVAAGRMAPDDELRRLAQVGVFALRDSHAEQTTATTEAGSGWRNRVRTWLGRR
ncbi:hypothetical protein R69746_05754 [Paraburkholderia aspalathi]|uniref:hypothetical protein n=1 Tax=Paraburkholderia aspalathi TaxID=1324617 RepID=UPI00190D01C2|nr:hypothetical protein [Paraburkholderia aspalathi]MBK3841884.1 hypothetical protein [Paraburkholderia aspalathi]CAE6814115.1 hypothetical protein R69746_05754 [Paraburkholderia aspalathi]